MLIGITYIVVFAICAVIAVRSRSHRVRQVVLCVASYLLYTAVAKWFVLLLLGSTAMNHLLGRWVQRRPSRVSLWVSIAANLVLLGSFKYLPAVVTVAPLGPLRAFGNIALPLGISFWTFQALSYIFDQYRGEDLDPSFLEFALYMAFFPVVISGPICRLPDMLPQFRTDTPVAPSSILRGFARIATGTLMMLVGRLIGQGILGAGGVVSGFDQLTAWSGTDVWGLAFGFGLQLFFDFAGYSHVAIGAAMALGILVPENFARPFASTTPSIFWTRWHMSLSFWIRDYVFLPLAVLRRDMLWRNFVLLLSMVLFGLWHKATLLFLLWGCYHGILLVGHRQIQRLKPRFDWNPPEKASALGAWALTMCLINLGWILFRANTLQQARDMFRALFALESYASTSLGAAYFVLVSLVALTYAVVVAVSDALSQHTAGTVAGEPEFQRNSTVGLIARSRWYWLPPLYAVTLLFLLLITFGQGSNAAQMMYRGF